MSTQKPVVSGTREVVCVPRVAYPEYYAQPWSEMLAAAEAGSDGLSVHVVRMLSSGLDSRKQMSRSFGTGMSFDARTWQRSLRKVGRRGRGPSDGMR